MKIGISDNLILHCLELRCLTLLSACRRGIVREHRD